MLPSGETGFETQAEYVKAWRKHREALLAENATVQKAYGVVVD